MGARTNTFVSFSILLFSLVSSAAFGEDYYRWVGENGVVEYGSTPPKGVQAVKIKTYGNFSEIKHTDTGKKTGTAVDAEELQKQIVDQRKQQCEDEKERLSTLQTSGTRIRMEQPDGSSRYLTPQEVSAEVKSSQKFIDEACK